MGAVVAVVATVAAAVLAPELLPVLAEAGAEEAVAATVVESAGEVAATDIAASSTVMDAVAADPVLVATADAAPETLAQMAADVVPETTTAATETAAVADPFQIPDIATATDQAQAVLQATGQEVAVGDASQAAAQNVIDQMGTQAVDQASQAAQMVQQGTPISDAVTAATDGQAAATPLTEAANTSPNVFDDLSNKAKGLVDSIGQTIAPEADPAVQRFVGQTAVNTAANKGDFEKGLESSVIGLGTGMVGSEVADVTGSDALGKAAGAATRGIVTGADPTNIAAGALGAGIGSEVADATGSNFAGQAASSVVKSAATGKDPITGLENLGINTIVNGGVDSVLDYASGLGRDSATTGTGDNPDNQNTPGNNAPSDTPAQVAAVPKDVQDIAQSVYEAPTAQDTTTGGLTSVSSPTASPTGALNDLSQSLMPESDVAIGNTAAPAAGMDQQQAAVEQPQDQTEQPAQPTQTAAQPSSSRTGALGMLGAVLKPMVGQQVRQAVMPTPAKRPVTSGLRAAAPKPAARVTAADLAKMTAKPASVAAPVYTPPKKVDVSKLTPITNISSLSQLLSKKG